MSPPPDPNAEALLAESTWLRNLALALAGDPHEADDLAQDAIVAALERRPDARDSFRPWLKTVTRRILVDRQRARARHEPASVEPRE